MNVRSAKAFSRRLKKKYDDGDNGRKPNVLIDGRQFMSDGGVMLRFDEQLDDCWEKMEQEDELEAKVYTMYAEVMDTAHVFGKEVELPLVKDLEMMVAGTLDINGKYYDLGNVRLLRSIVGKCRVYFVDKDCIGENVGKWRTTIFPLVFIGDGVCGAMINGRKY